MLLVSDIGNTNITLGIYDGLSFVKTLRLNSDTKLSGKEYEDLICRLLNNYQISACIIASVVSELSGVIKAAIDNLYGINSILLSDCLDLGMRMNVDNASEVGADRIANAFAAKMMYTKPAIVVDFGTATTFDIINADGDFIGGVIMPGINSELKALYNNTSKLPKIEVDFSRKAIGANTKDAILSGVIRGSACAVEGLIAQCEKELGAKACVIATGGYSTLVAKYMTKSFDYLNPSLTLDGIRLAYEYFIKQCKPL